MFLAYCRNWYATQLIEAQNFFFLFPSPLPPPTTCQGAFKTMQLKSQALSLSLSPQTFPRSWSMYSNTFPQLTFLIEREATTLEFFLNSRLCYTLSVNYFTFQKEKQCHGCSPPLPHTHAPLIAFFFPCESWIHPLRSESWVLSHLPFPSTWRTLISFQLPVASDACHDPSCPSYESLHLSQPEKEKNSNK